MAFPTKLNSVVTNPGGTGTTITPTLSTHAAGDLIEIFVSKTGNATWTAPAGWTIRHQTVSPGTSSTATVGTLLYRRVLSGDSLPLPSPVCNLGATVTRHAISRTIRGADVEGVYTLPEWSATGSTSGTNNPIRPPAVTTPAPEMLVTHYYCQRVATNAPEPTGYTQDQEVITSGTLVTNVSEKNVADQQTALTNQDASPTSGGRWVGMISCAPSPDYSYYRSGSQALTASGTSATPGLPTGTSSSDNRSNKDLIIATVECAGTPTITPNTPADWTAIPEWSNTTSGNGTTVRKYRAFYDGTLDRQFNRSTTGEIFVYFSTYRNAHQSTPLGGASVQQNASATSSAWPALARTATKATIQATCVADATPTYTAPTGWTERNDSQGVTCADQPFNATGTVASASFTLNSASPTLVGLLEVASVASAISVVAIPATASLALTSFTPKLILTLTPAAGALTVSAFAPSTLISGGGILTDNFDDNSRDTSKWALGSIAFENTSVGVAEANQQVEITPLSNEPSPAIYGYRSANTYDFTGKQTEVRIAASLASDVEAWLVVVLDANNYLRTWVAGGVLNTRSRVGGGNTNVDHGAFNFTTQSHWRIRHDSDSDEIVWEVGDGVEWIELRRITRPFAVTGVSFYLSGGTGASIASPALVKFDDFTMNVLTLLVPTTAAAVTTGFAPAVQTKLIPASASISLSGLAPAVVVTGGETIVTPATQTLTTTTFAATLRIRITPSTATLALSSFTARLASAITPAIRSLTTTALAPALQTATTPAAPTLSLSTFAPSIVTRIIGVPATASLTTAVFSPSLRAVSTPSTRGLSLATLTPTVAVSQNVAVVPDAATLTFISLTPSLRIAITTTTGALTTTAFAPQLVQRLTPAATAASLSTLAPTVTIGILATPATVTLSTTGLAPALRQVITANTANLLLAASAPLVTVGDDVAVGPVTVNLSLVPQAASLRFTLTPATGTVTATTFVVQLRETAIPATVLLVTAAPAPALSLRLIPATAPVSLTVYTPAVDLGGETETVAPVTATLTLTSHVPAVRELFPTPPRRTFMVESGRRIVIVPREVRTYKPAEEDREAVLT